MMITTGSTRWAWRRTRRWLVLPLAAAAAAAAGGADAQSANPRLPFGPGEESVFRVSSPRVGRIGTGYLRVSGGEQVRGQDAWLLRFDVNGRIALATVHDQTRSWIVPGRMTALRYTKQERSPLGRRDQDVSIDPAQRRWTEGGEQGVMTTDAPLDELSFLFYLRTVPLETGATYNFSRHYDQRRNPVRIRVIGRTRLTVPAGTFDVVEVEMQVRDPERFGGGAGILQIHLSDDARRLPVRIESTAPVLGRIVLSLQSYTRPS